MSLADETPCTRELAEVARVESLSHRKKESRAMVVIRADQPRPESVPIGQVTCPNCRVAMPRVSLKSSGVEKNLQEGVYRCPRCDTETKRWIKL
jgi:hypothetical protein